MNADYPNNEPTWWDETKQAFKTTEFYAWLVGVLGILIAAKSISGEGDDYFAADKAWLYITILTVGYMLSRGLAKSGSRHLHQTTHHSDHGLGVGERLSRAVEAFKGEEQDPNGSGNGQTVELQPGTHRERL